MNMNIILVLGNHRKSVNKLKHFSYLHIFIKRRAKSFIHVVLFMMPSFSALANEYISFQKKMDQNYEQRPVTRVYSISPSSYWIPKAFEKALGNEAIKGIDYEKRADQRAVNKLQLTELKSKRNIEEIKTKLSVNPSSNQK